MCPAHEPVALVKASPYSPAEVESLSDFLSHCSASAWESTSSPAAKRARQVPAGRCAAKLHELPACGTIQALTLSDRSPSTSTQPWLHPHRIVAAQTSQAGARWGVRCFVLPPCSSMDLLRSFGLQHGLSMLPATAHVARKYARRDADGLSDSSMVSSSHRDQRFGSSASGLSRIPGPRPTGESLLRSGLALRYTGASTMGGKHEDQAYALMPVPTLQQSGSIHSAKQAGRQGRRLPHVKLTLGRGSVLPSCASQTWQCPTLTLNNGKPCIRLACRCLPLPGPGQGLEAACIGVTLMAAVLAGGSSLAAPTASRRGLSGDADQPSSQPQGTSRIPQPKQRAGAPPSDPPRPATSSSSSSAQPRTAADAGLVQQYLQKPADTRAPGSSHRRPFDTASEAESQLGSPQAGLSSRGNGRMHVPDTKRSPVAAYIYGPPARALSDTASEADTQPGASAAFCPGPRPQHGGVRLTAARSMRRPALAGFGLG